MRLLLKAKADVLMRDRLGFSALHFAANQSVGLVSDLVEAKCDVNAANLQQMTPLHSAAGMGRVDICHWAPSAVFDRLDPPSWDRILHRGFPV